IKKPISTACLKMYFEGNPPANQFLCRAYLCQGQLKSPPEDFEEAVVYFLKAIEISKQEPRLHFMVFNASVLYFQTVQPLLQPGRSLHLVPSLRQVVQSLQEVADHDHSWRAELMMQVLSYLDLINMSSCDFGSYSLKIHRDNELSLLTSSLFMTTASCSLIAFLLELALLALQVKHQKVAADCLKELKSSGEAVMMEVLCRRCDRRDSQSVVVIPQARLKEIGKLDQWLQTAVRGGGPQAVQAVCATQWNLCLPLLQHNLRKCIKTPLLRVAQALEETQSMLLELRCQVHSELAVTEEEEGRLEASLTHFQKAMLLDNGTQQERLSSAFRLLQLRQTLYQTPSRIEDKAAMLMQQARDMPPQDKTHFRPVLVAVGLLLAPDDFQMVLDADDTSKILICNLSLFRGCFRVRLWATLAKTARKHEVWDVCRAACGFCLLYDDGRWKKTDSKMMNDLKICEINVFFLVQATIQKLLEEGVQLNSPAVPPQDKRFCVSEEDPHWVIYRDWIQALCAYTTSNFLRAGELGAEIGESWVVANAAIYLWNYNSHLLAAREYTREHSLFVFLRNRVLFVLLCDAVAQGLIQPLFGPAPAEDKGKKRAEKGIAKALCEYALRISNSTIPGETVPISARKRVLATWVQIHGLLQQQTGSKMNIPPSLYSHNPLIISSSLTTTATTIIFIPSPLSTLHLKLVSMASECRWSNAVVELQVWCQLAAFCHDVKDYSLVCSCTKRALLLEEAATKSLNTMPCVL
uniref:Cilia and flagella associated protein 46 n=1 Tax=Neolamprologus brichardi TaxID=32507 RepID=A0A3Q4HM04_NEOBR